MTKRKPWGRVLVEGFVIVGSILLAFGIEAAWQRRQTTATRDAFVSLLRADLQQNISTMEARNARADSIVAGLESASRIVDGVAPMPAADSLAILFNYCLSASSFTPALSAYDVLRGLPDSDFLPPDVQVKLAEYLQGIPPLDLAIQVHALAGLIELAGNYGGVNGLVSRSDRAMSVGESFQGTESGDHLGLFADPLFASWMWGHLVVVRNERRWRADWIVQLRDVARTLDTL